MTKRTLLMIIISCLMLIGFSLGFSFGTYTTSKVPKIDKEPGINELLEKTR